MKRFLAVYIGTEDALARVRWNELDDEKRKSLEAAGFKAWMDWGTANAAAIVEKGVPSARRSALAAGHLRHQEQPDRVHDRPGRIARGSREAVREPSALHDLPGGLGGNHGVPAAPGAVMPAIHAPRIAALLVAVGATMFGAAPAPAEERITPLLLAVHDAPMPFDGSDGRTHLVYELWITNFSSGEATVERAERARRRPDPRDLDRVGRRAASSPPAAAMRRPRSGSGTSLLFVHVILAGRHAVAGEAVARGPRAGRRRAARPAGDDGERRRRPVDRRIPVVIGPPLAGERYIAADSCCDATRHSAPRCRSTAGSPRPALRGRLGAGGRRGPHLRGSRESRGSYTIYGKEALAVADATVASVVDGLPEQTPGKFPEAISITQADGNSVVLDLGDGRFALYAHLQPAASACEGRSRRARSGHRAGRQLGQLRRAASALPRDGRRVAPRFERPPLRDRRRSRSSGTRRGPPPSTTPRRRARRSPSRRSRRRTRDARVAARPVDRPLRAVSGRGARFNRAASSSMLRPCKTSSTRARAVCRSARSRPERPSSPTASVPACSTCSSRARSRS